VGIPPGLGTESIAVEGPVNAHPAPARVTRDV